MTSPRSGWLKSGVCVFLWLAFALAAILSLALVIAEIIGFVGGGDSLSPRNFFVGLVCSLIAWLFFAVFHLRKETVLLRVSDRPRFEARLRKILVDLGYRSIETTENEWRTRPEFLAFLFGPGVRINLDGAKAAITGPRFSLERIRAKYRVVSHLEKVQDSQANSKTRLSECYLKRCELSLRLTPTQLAEFQSKVVEPLANHGEVLLELQLMATCPDGLPESRWIHDIQPWLDQEGIFYEFHKDHPQRVFPPPQAQSNSVDGLIDTCVWS